MIKVLAIAATDGGLGDAVSSRQTYAQCIHHVLLYTDCLIGAIFRTHPKTNASQSLYLLGMDQCVLYMYIIYIYILYSTSRYANMVYEVYTIHIYSRLSHELEGKKHIKKYINNHWHTQILHGAGIFFPSFTQTITQLCRWIYQHHGAYGINMTYPFR